MSQEAGGNGLPRLESMEINPGEIVFDPEVLEYTVQVDEDVTKLLVKAKASEGQTYTISGNSNLEPGMNEVLVTVTGDQYEQTVYRIHVQVGQIISQEADSTAQDLQPQTVQQSFAEHMMSGRNRYVTIGLGICAVLAVVLWITFLVNRILTKRELRRLKEEKQQRKQKTAQRLELARQQEEELLRQIERLAQKSRTMKTTDADGLRVIQLDEDEDALDEDAYEDEYVYEDDDAYEEEDPDMYEEYNEEYDEYDDY